MYWKTKCLKGIDVYGFISYSTYTKLTVHVMTSEFLTASICALPRVSDVYF